MTYSLAGSEGRKCLCARARRLHESSQLGVLKAATGKSPACRRQSSSVERRVEIDPPARSAAGLGP
jgi:hypothetical protein